MNSLIVSLFVLNCSWYIYEMSMVEGSAASFAIENEVLFNATKSLQQRKFLKGQHFYSVYDNLISSKQLAALFDYLKIDINNWQFNFLEKRQKIVDNVPWFFELDPLWFGQMNISACFVQAIIDAANADYLYHPYRVLGKIIRRGDDTKIAVDSDDDDDFSVIVFLNEFWRNDDYGEIYFYDSTYELYSGVSPKPGRVVIWNSTIPWLNRPPSIDFKRGQIFLHVLFTKNKTKMFEGHKNWMVYRKERHLAQNNPFLSEYNLPGKYFTQEDLVNHQACESTTKTGGHKVNVYDNIFPIELLDSLKRFVLNYGSFYYDDSDGGNGNDNVQWIAGFETEAFIDSHFSQIIDQVVCHYTGKVTMFPFDVSMNLVRYSDHTCVHRDVSYLGEEVVTLLLYLSSGVSQGETVFFEMDEEEVLTVVQPKYGRAVVFDGNIPHSARPSSSSVTETRLSFAVKFYRNEFTAREKILALKLDEYRNMALIKRSFEKYAGRYGNIYAQIHLKTMESMLRDKVAGAPTKEREVSGKQDRGILSSFYEEGDADIGLDFLKELRGLTEESEDSVNLLKSAFKRLTLLTDSVTKEIEILFSNVM